MTTSSTPSFLQSLDLNYTPTSEYAAIVDGQVTERYQNAAPAMKSYGLAMSRLAHADWGGRVLGCCRSGSTVAVCDRGKFANAHRHHCGDQFCINCCSGRYRFNKWASKRDPEVFQRPHMAFEVKLPGVCKCDKSWAEKQIDTAAMLGGIVWNVMKELELDHVTVDSYAENISDVSVRVVFQGSLTYTQLQYRIDKMTPKFAKKNNGNPQVTVKHGGTMELFHWAFNGFKELAEMDADRKAELRIALADHRSVMAWGDSYKPLSKEQLYQNEMLPNLECICPICNDHPLTPIPPSERHARPIEDILAEYEHVNWGREHDSPFLIRRRSLTNKTATGYRDIPTEIAVESPPPPW